MKAEKLYRKAYILIGALALTAVALFAVSFLSAPASAATDVVELPAVQTTAVFAKYDGVDGESQDADHDKWIDVLSIDWGIHKPGGGATGQSRRRGAAVAEDFVLVKEIDKSSPKLSEALAQGKVIPKLEIELVGPYGTYMRYELKNVMVTSYEVNAGEGDEGRGQVVVGNNFEEIKVTYTEYDESGKTKGNVEHEWKVEKGR